LHPYVENFELFGDLRSSWKATQNRSSFYFCTRKDVPQSRYLWWYWSGRNQHCQK